MLHPNSNQKFFTLKETGNLLLTLVSLAIITTCIAPTLVSVGYSSRRSNCPSFKKQLGVGVQVYLMDFDDQFPFAGHSDFYHSSHTDRFAQVVIPYVRQEAFFECIMVIHPKRKQNQADAQVVNTGTAYFCGHGPMDGKSSLYDSPFRKLLLRNGPNGESNPKGEAILDEVDHYFVCGHKMSEITDPATAPMLMCNGFVHDPEKKTAMEWEWEFLPKSLGGSGRMAEAGTVLVRADSSAKFPKGNYGEMMELLGLRKPLFLARKSK